MPKRPRTRRHAATAASNSSPQKGDETHLARRIVQGLHERSNPQTKAWFTNYVKGTLWIGCKLPVVRGVVKDVLRQQPGTTDKKTSTTTTSSSTTTSNSNDKSTILLDNAICLLQNEACDAKLAGMLLLQEHMPLEQLATPAVLDRFDRDLWKSNSNSNDGTTGEYIADWSTADWFAVRVLSKIALAPQRNDNNSGELSSLAHRILNYTSTGQTLWQRRCGLVAFLQFYKHRDVLPSDDFGLQIIQAAEDSLLRSPNERFTQTGIAWVLRYVLVQSKDHSTEERDAALAMICRHPSIWTKEAKKSLVEKLAKKDPRRSKILNLK